MRYGISAAALVVRDGRLLLAHHVEPGRYDFWTPPGGGLEGEESILDCVRREALEETGLVVEPRRIAYVEEFVEPGSHFCKFFVWCESDSGDLTLANREEDEQMLIELRFWPQADLTGLTVYPSILEDQFWNDLEVGFPQTRYLGLSRIDA